MDHCVCAYRVSSFLHLASPSSPSHANAGGTGGSLASAGAVRRQEWGNREEATHNLFTLQASRLQWAWLEEERNLNFR